MDELLVFLTLHGTPSSIEQTPHVTCPPRESEGIETLPSGAGG